MQKVKAQSEDAPEGAARGEDIEYNREENQLMSVLETEYFLAIFQLLYTHMKSMTLHYGEFDHFYLH